MDKAERYKIFTQTLHDYFTKSPYENEVLLLLLLPTIIILIWLYYSMQPSARRTTTPSSKRDLEFFETARLQKGLESFDRDLLIELAEQSEIRPIYRILLEKPLYDKALKQSEEAAAQKLPGSRDRKTLDYLRRLGKKIFTPEI